MAWNWAEHRVNKHTKYITKAIHFKNEQVLTVLFEQNVLFCP